MSITVNLYYTGNNGNARKFAEEMMATGVVDAIRAEAGNERYEYFYSLDDPEIVLLIDKWRDQEALDLHHKSEMMQTIAALRKKYNLRLKVERFMDFSLSSIKEAHEQYTGPDFPKLIKAFKSMGMVTNVFNIETGIVTYIDGSGKTLENTGIKVGFEICETGNLEDARSALQRNQSGESDFYTFCIEIARAGVYKWVSDLEEMTCTYYDKTEHAIIKEIIPSV